FSNTVYDLKVTNKGILYACGNGFVAATSIPITGCADSACGKGILTGINTISNTNSVTLYPNPNNGKFTIHFSANGQSMNNCQIGIYNVLGQKIYSQILQQAKGDYEIDLSTQSKGVYLYRVLTETGASISIGKIIIQ
ncbi:MAG TPA: T9SS type A sorting domain-containing protein, partial [Bacteroidia bacterium]|nr:T9SS type A sorting domain-containing protein [Bacteroidia bacterium]